MTLTEKDIERLVKTGVTMLDHEGKPIKLGKKSVKDKTELEYLKLISELIGTLIHAKTEAPVVNLPAPVVTVKPEVTVQSTPIKKWEFELIKNRFGQTARIIATVIE